MLIESLNPIRLCKLKQFLLKHRDACFEVSAQVGINFQVVLSASG